MSMKLVDCVNALLDLLVRSPRFQLARHYDLEAPTASLVDWLSSLTTERRQLVAAIVGEFNAGKSALVNALYGRTVAFSDPFDATMTSAKFIPDSDEYVLLFHVDSSSRRCTLDEYLTSCRERSLSQVVHAEVHLCCDSPLILVDTPGLATVNEQHTERAEASIRDAEIVVWLIDPSDLLSAQEGGFLQRARSIGLPIVPVLSKADSLSAGEIDECLTALCDRLDFDRDDFIPLSAERHLQQQDGDTGVHRLLSTLDDFLANPERTRKSAQAARRIEIVEQSTRIAKTLESRLVDEARWASAERELILVQKELLVKTLDDACRNEVASLLKTHLSSDLSANQTVDDLNAFCTACIAQLAKPLTAAAERIRTRMQDEARHVWDQPFQERSADLEQQIQKLMEDAVANQDTIDFLSQQLDETRRRREAIGTSITRSGGRQGPVGEAVIEIIGAITSFLSGRTGPYFASKVVNLVRRMFSNGSANPPAKLTRSECVSALTDALVDQLMSGMSGSIDAWVEAIAGDALGRLTSEKFNGRTLDVISEALQGVKSILVELRGIRNRMTE